MGCMRQGPFIPHVCALLQSPADAQLKARWLCDNMALAFGGALLVADGNPDVAEAFLASRLPPVGTDGLVAHPRAMNFGAAVGGDVSLDRISKIVERF